MTPTPTPTPDTALAAPTPQVLAVTPTATPTPNFRYPGGHSLIATAIADFVLHYTNEERRAAGLPEFEHDLAISAIAQAHSQNMARTGLSKHTIDGKDPTDRAIEAGYTCRRYFSDGSYTYGLSENIYMYPRVRLAYETGRIAEYVVTDVNLAFRLVHGWMDSPLHKANILDPDSRRIGIGIAISETVIGSYIHETVYATQNFSSCL